jgi:hypothetical protein
MATAWGSETGPVVMAWLSMPDMAGAAALTLHVGRPLEA